MKEVLEQIFGAENVTEENLARFHEELGKRFVAKADYNTKAEEVKTLSAQIGERDKQLKELSKSAENNKELSEQIAQLQAYNKAAKESYDKQIGELKFNSALESALLKSGALDSDLVKVKLNRDQLKLREDGTLSGLEEQLKNVKENYSFLFQDKTTQITGARPADGEKQTETDPFLQGFEQ